ncbi:MAG TPA: hypothetical protein DHU16_01275, partial [Gammaproteobacteria bacterium]|nr:hypothetical protein [Gammaproteobacteria bacterium]
MNQMNPLNQLNPKDQGQQGRTIFELGSVARRASAQRVDGADAQCLSDLPQHLLRVEPPEMPEVSEL